MKLYFFGFPGEVGGASTKFTHLLVLLGQEYELAVVPFDETEPDARWRQLFEALGVRWLPYEKLPQELDGWGVLLCHFGALGSERLTEVRRRGLRLAWSNEMMWTVPNELASVGFGLFDAVLYVSPAQRRTLEPEYLRVLTGIPPETRELADAAATEGWLRPGSIRWVMTGNYIAPAEYPFQERPLDPGNGGPIVIGRLSRPDRFKFPDDFPDHYEGLGLKNARFRVMAWDKELARRWNGHDFDERWEFLSMMAERPANFLQSLDLFVYELGPKFNERWGRSTVEAMLTGAVPLVPADRRHHLHALVPHGEAGFHCDSQEEFGHYARLLEEDPVLRLRMSRRAREWAETKLCNADEHRALWRRVFYGGDGG